MPRPARAAFETYCTPSQIIVRNVVWTLLRRNVELAIPTLLVGPTGCGKTTVAHDVATSLNRKAEVFHVGGLFDPEPAVLGTTVLRGGETQFRRSRFADAAETPGQVIILDEINRAPGSILNLFLSITDHQRRFAIDIADDERRIVELAPDVAIIATANVGSDYVHTERLDLSLLDRLIKIRMDYPVDESSILTTRGVDERTTEHVLRAAKAVRKEHAKQTIEGTVTTRSLEKIAGLLRDGHDIEVAFEAVVSVFDEEGLAALRTIIRTAADREVRP